MSNLTPTRARGRTLRATIGTLVAAGLAIGGVAALPATQANAAEKTATFANQQITRNGVVVDASSEIPVGGQLRFETDWSISGQVNAGDTFQIPLPLNVGIVSSAPFKLTKGAQTMATCTYDTTTSPGVINCVFEGGPHASPSGDLWFIGALQAPPPGNPPPEWQVGGVVLPLPVPHIVPPGPWTPPFGTFKNGGGEIVDGKAIMNWNVYMWPGSGPGANEAVKTFTISDNLSSTAPDSPHTLVADSFVINRWQRVGETNEGVPGTHVVIPLDGTSAFTPSFGEVLPAPVVNATGTSYSVTLSNLEYGYEYRLSYKSEATGAVSFESDTFKNVATVNGVEEPATASPRAYGGGGADAGQYTSFMVSKSVTNNTKATLPESYELVATQGTLTETLTVPADGSAINSGYFDTSSPIVLCETVPTVDGVTWEPYTITGAGVTGPDADGCYSLTPVGGERISINLVNIATPTVVVPPVPPLVGDPGPNNQPPVKPAPPVLAQTGLDFGPMAAAALILLLAGGLSVMAMRRRVDAQQ